MVFEVTILGSSSALPTSLRYPSAHVLNSHERFFLIDCGEGTQMQLRRNRIRISRINNIFISHTHGDHIFGLYGLLSSLNLMGRKAPLKLYAPQHFGALLNSHLDDFDIHLGYELEFVPVYGNDPMKLYEDKNITISSLPLKHRVPTYGYLFKEKTRQRKVVKELIKEYQLTLKEIVGLKRGEDVVRDSVIIKNSDLSTDPPSPRSYAYCCDTQYFSRLSSMVKAVSLLYHDSTFANDNKKLAGLTGHSTAEQAAKLALKAGAQRLLIGHFSARYKDVDVLLNEARSIFPNTIAAEDNLTVSI